MRTINRRAKRSWDGGPAIRRPLRGFAPTSCASVQERIQQERLIDPPTDSAKYFLLSLRNQDSNFPRGSRARCNPSGGLLFEKARRAQDSKQWSAAQKFVQEAGAIGYNSPELTALGAQIQTAARQRSGFLVERRPRARIANAAPCRTRLFRPMPCARVSRGGSSSISPWTAMDRSRT